MTTVRKSRPATRRKTYLSVAVSKLRGIEIRVDLEKPAKVRANMRGSVRKNSPIIHNLRQQAT